MYNFDVPSPDTAPPNSIQGAWSGYFLELSDGEMQADEGLIQLVFDPVVEGKIQGKAVTYMGHLDFSGEVAEGEGHNMTFTVTWEDEYVISCSGSFDEHSNTIEGVWSRGAQGVTDDDSDDESDSDEEGSDDDGDGDGKGDGESQSESASAGEDEEQDSKEEDAGHDEKDAEASESKDAATADEAIAPKHDGPKKTFIFRRTPASAQRFRYTPAQFAENSARARWYFAIAAALHQARQKRFSWAFLKERFAERRRFMKLLTASKIARFGYTPWSGLTSEETKELLAFKRDVDSLDANFYGALANFDIQHLTWQ